MPGQSRISQLRWSSLSGAAAASLLGLLLACFSVGDGLTRFSFDLPFCFLTRQPDPDAVLIYADDVSRKGLNQQFNAPWSRDLHVQLLETLVTNGAKMVFFDVAFLDNDERTDARFAAAMRTHTGTFLAAAVYEPWPTNGYELLLPNEVLRGAMTGWGLLTFDREDSFRGIRHIPLGFGEWPSASWVMAAHFMPAGSMEKVRRSAPNLWLNYYGPADSLTNISFLQALSGVGLPPDFFEGKYVFVGGRSTLGFIGQRRDEFVNPWSRFHPDQYPDSPGLEIHATAFLNLLRGDWLERLPFGVEWSLLGLFGLAAGYGLSVLRPLRSAGLAFLLMLLIPLVDLILVAQSRLWFAWAIAAWVQVPFALGWSVLFHSIRARMESALLEETLGRHLSPQRARQILRRPELLKPGVERQEVSILFSDIANFAKVSDMKNPVDLAALLNNYYAAALECVRETDGTVMDLIGDAIFAIWNAPEPQKNHQRLACQTALLLQESLDQFDAGQRAFPLRTRVGLHAGTVCVGNIGSAARFDYTAIGTEVNLASRLEGLNKMLGTRILASRELQMAVGDDLLCREVGAFRFKGLDRVTEVLEIRGWKDKSGENSDRWQGFDEALKAFKWKRFSEAQSGFSRVLETCPDDGPSQFYLKELDRIRLEALPSDWMGVIQLGEK